MADQVNITRRSMFRGLPLAAIATSLPKLAENPPEAEPEPELNWERFQDNMDRLRDKAARLTVGAHVKLDDKPYDADSPAPGMHTVAMIDETFIKVSGNDDWVPIERVTGELTIL